jgi:hypothetical protein
MYSVGIGMPPERKPVLHGYLEKLHEAMEPWGAEGGYYNFIEAACDVDAILPPDVCDRLAEVKRKWDPDGRIVANHQVSLGAA